MPIEQTTRLRSLGWLCTLAASLPASAQPLGTGFTYQGQLTESNQAATGLYDLQVCVFDSAANPLPIACAPDFNDVPVADGVFAIALDFGSSPFVGQQRFLELRVRPGASTGGYTILAPRQLIRATPEALRANVSSAAPWAGLTGVPVGFADNVDNDSGGTVTSVAAGTGLSGGTITGSGTIGIANGGVGTPQIASGAVGTAQLANASVTGVQLATNAVSSAALADNAVDTGAVQNLAVTQAKIATGAVGSSQLATGAVGLSQINPAQVQARIAGTCAIGEYFRGINADGTVACEPVPGVPRITTVDDPANRVGRFSSIAIGTDGLPVISYYDDTAGDLKVAKCANAACTGVATITTVDATNNVGQYTSIAIGTDGLPVISYHNVTAGDLKVAKCGNAACAGSATITTVDAANTVGWDTSITIGTDGLPVISYLDQTAGDLKVAKCTNAACTGTATITIVDATNNVGSYTSIAIGTDGRPVISYHGDTTEDLKVARCGNTACTGSATITTVDATNAVGTFTSIAIGTDGLPVVSYQAGGSASDLKVAKCTNAACTGTATITTVDASTNLVGFFTSIAIGTDGLPVISYYDFTAGDLKVAKCGNAACTGTATITTVDAANVVGAHTSIAIGTDGLPVTSYFDATTDALKVAKCGTRSCQ